MTVKKIMDSRTEKDPGSNSALVTSCVALRNYFPKLQFSDP